jgi:hypothetical protein
MVQSPVCKWRKTFATNRTRQHGVPLHHAGIFSQKTIIVKFRPGGTVIKPKITIIELNHFSFNMTLIPDAAWNLTAPGKI